MLAASLVSCGGNGDSAGQATENSLAELGQPVPSLMGVPVPEAATLDEEAQLPPDLDWSGWTWCEADTGFPYREKRAYYRGGESLDVNYRDPFVLGDGTRVPTTLQISYSNQVVPACGSR